LPWSHAVLQRTVHFTLRIIAGIAALLLAACASLPASVQRTPSHAFADTSGTTIARTLAPGVAAHPQLTKVHALSDARAAFAARHRLAEAAERSIDVQYYIWHSDSSGSLLAHALWEAAERGVRVRVLLDDVNTRGLDTALAALDAHPNIEVRLFNPFANRSWRVADFSSDFARVNRRMHNKAFIADNQVAVVGGRNIGDEYMGASGEAEFADLDVMAAGAVVADVSASFDAYWNSASAYPAGALLPAMSREASREAAASWISGLEGNAKARAYLEELSVTQVLPLLREETAAAEWTTARMLSDDPAKVLRPAERNEQGILPRLLASLGTPQRELLLVSPYFVPTREGTEALAAIAARGVQVIVLTNSLASTDVALTYAGYARYRRDLLRAGVRLYELMPTPPLPADGNAKRRSSSSAPGSGTGRSSGASLHAKTLAVDRERIFVGSFNLDPRSARLNTESGMVLESRRLAERLSDAFARDIPQHAYEVRLDESGNGLVWIERRARGEVRHSSSPGAGLLRRLGVSMLGWLPIEWLL
jgi:cardiolipin synthase C